MKRNAKNWRIMKKTYDEIWEERGYDQCKRLCEFCEVGIGSWDMEKGDYVWAAINFQHVKRGRYKGEWNDKTNIKLICVACHAWQDHKERVINQ